MKRHFVLAILATAALAVPCRAESFFKDALRSATQGMGQQQQGVAGAAAGSTNLPAGQYMMTNMYNGQGFYVTITPQGQMFAQDPRTVQVVFQPAQGQFVNQGMPPQDLQQGMPGMPQQAPQQGGGFGSLLKNTLMNNFAQPQQ